MTQLYQAGTYYASEEAGYSDYAAQEKTLSLTFARLVANLKKRGLTGGKLLEVGCGYGYLLREARPEFGRVEATDYARAAAERASRYVDRFYVGGLDQVEGRDFDLAVANHVIEHVYDPAGFTADLAARLKPGGTLLLSTPHMGSAWRLVMGGRWPSFKLPEHILYFDRDSLTRLLANAGLTDIQRFPYPHAFPLALTASKLGLRAPKALADISLWIPGTTLALTARKPL